jgi:hypothetical protein
MNALQTRLAALRRRLRFVTLARGLSLIVLVLLGGVLAAGLLDWTADLPGLIRAVLLVVILGGSGLIAWRYLLAPLAAQADDLALALRVEEAYPTLNDALASTVQFLQQPESASAGSPILRREAVQRALRLAEGCDFTKVVNSRGLRLTELAAIAILGVAAILLWRQPALSATALLRLANPYGEHDWPKATQLALDFRQRIAIGQPFVLKGDVSGVVPGKAVIEFEGLSSSREVKEYPIQKADKEATAGTFSAKLDMTRQQYAFRFRVRANDATFPRRPSAWQTVDVAQPPRLAALNGAPSPQWELHYPAYTDLRSPVKLPPGAGQVEAIAGTDVLLRAATDRPIASASIRFLPAEEVALPGLALTPLGLRSPLGTLASLAGGAAVRERTPAHLEAGGKRFNIAFRPWLSGMCVLRLEDDEGLAKEYEYQLRVLPDPVPSVALVRPLSSQSVLPDAEIRLGVIAEDETFALRSVYLEYRRKDKEGRPLDEPGRVSLYDRRALGAALPQLASALAMQLVPVPAPAWRLRPKRLEIGRRWFLAGLVQEGDILVIQACADDFNDVAAHRIPGRSAEIELRIVGRQALAAILDEAQGKMQKELLRLREWQEKALKKVIEVQEQHKATGKLRPEDHDGLIEAEQLQKQIEARVGETSDQGLRGELKKLEQMIRDNKLPPSGARDRLKVMKNELERLAREHLPQIEPEITSARQELAEEGQAKEQPAQGKTNPKDKSGAPKQQKQDNNQTKNDRADAELAKARAHQQEVQQSFEELLKYLDHWAGLNEIKAETRAALQEQKDLKNELEKTSREYRPKDEQSRAALRKVAEFQRRLADRVERLLDKMDRISQEKAAKDPTAAQMLDKSAKIGRDNDLVKEIRDTADRQLDPKDDRTEKPLPPNLNLGIRQQGESIKTLDRMVAALEEQHQAEVERLVKKQKEEQHNLEELQERLEQLEKKVQEAKKIADPEQQKAELKRLGQEQRKLEEEARKKARELARLQAPRAGKEMEQAAEQMGQAAKQLDNGDDPDEAQEQAKDKLKKAKQELQEAQKEAQDELAREQLLRLADQIKGLKDRQDEAVKESARIHRRVLQQGWGGDLLDSLRDHRDVQRGLGKEAESLKEKLKGAPVFELMMKKAGRAMDAAAGTMDQRKDKAIVRRGVFPLDKEALADENHLEEKTEKLQKEASHRLDRLLTALKPMLEQAKQEQEGEQGEQGGGGPKKGGIRGGDAIPPLAQLKALRDEQQEVKERTEAFAKAHPDTQKLGPEQRAELEALHTDQDELFRLFRELMTQANEGEKQ